jgi:hypothetical protein
VLKSLGFKFPVEIPLPGVAAHRADGPAAPLAALGAGVALPDSKRPIEIPIEF